MIEKKVDLVVGKKCIASVLTFPYKRNSWSEHGVLLTHGAGGDMNSKYLLMLIDLLNSNGFVTFRFTSKSPNFAYRLKCFIAALEYFKDHAGIRRCIIGGQSMGARVAAEVGTIRSFDNFIQGIACFSYPLHKPNKYDQLRTSHLINLHLPVFIANGTSDSMCRKDLMESILVDMKANITMHWVKEADHSLKVNGSLNEEVEQVNKIFLDWCKYLLGAI